MDSSTFVTFLHIDVVRYFLLGVSEVKDIVRSEVESMA